MIERSKDFEAMSAFIQSIEEGEFLSDISDEARRVLVVLAKCACSMHCRGRTEDVCEKLLPIFAEEQAIGEAYLTTLKWYLGDGS